MSAQTYIVAARRWELHIADAGGAEIGVTQSSTLSGAERMVRDYLALDGHDAVVAVEIRPEADPVAGGAN